MIPKLKTLTIFGVLFIGIFLGFWLLSNALACGKLLSSGDVHEATKKNVIITEYIYVDSDSNILSCQLKPIEAWAEYFWEYKDVWGNIKIHEGHQFLVRYSPK